MNLKRIIFGFRTIPKPSVHTEEEGMLLKDVIGRYYYLNPINNIDEQRKEAVNYDFVKQEYKCRLQ